VLAVALVLGVHMVNGSGRAVAANSPLGYLLSAQNSDGGFGSAPGQSSSELYSGWAALALASEGVNPQGARNGGQSLTGYLAAGVGSLTDPGSLERTILAVRAAGLNAASFGGRDLVSALQRDFGRNGSISDQTNLTSFALLALRAAGVAPPGATARWLIRQQDRDGGFNYGTAGGSSDVDDTGAVVEALAGVGGGAAHAAISRAVTYLTRHQDRDGGFPSFPGEGSNAQSTAWAVQGLVAAGVDPGGLHRGGAPSPSDYLDSLLASDGHIRYSRGSNTTPVWVTAEAVMALVGKPLPIAAPAPKAARAHPAAVTPAKRTRPKIAKHQAKRAHRPSKKARVRTTQTATANPAMGYLGLVEALVFAPVGLG
jgi:prenyltransferase beta subunit